MRRIILDTDVGDDMDDAYALALALRAPELELAAVLTAGGAVRERAAFARELVRRAGATVPVYEGVDRGRGTVRQRLAGAEPATAGPRLDEPLDELQSLLADGPATLVSIGGLTNAAHLLDALPPAARCGLDVVAMGGSFERNYHGAAEPVAETNIRRDPAAARAVLDDDAPVTLVPLDCTWNVALTEPWLGRVHRADDPLGAALAELYGQWRREYGYPCPILHDPTAVALVTDGSLAPVEEASVRIDEDGFTRYAADGPCCRVAGAARREAVVRSFAQRVAPEAVPAS